MNAFAGQIEVAATKLNDWDRAMIMREDAKARYDDHSETLWEPVADELDRIAPRPDLWFEVTARNGQIARFYLKPNDINGWDTHWSAEFRNKAGKVRDAWLAHLAAREALGWDAVCDENTRLCNLMCAAESELIRMPAPDVKALLWKFQHMFGTEARDPDGSGASWCPAWMDALMADVERLLGASMGGA